MTLPQGEVVGALRDGCLAWLGIPYAAASGGAARFLAPQPAPGWSGPRAATAFGPACPQWRGPRLAAGAGHDEDCLSINIWSPTAEGEKRPVLVYLYGGAFVAGQADPWNPAHFVRDGDVVAVTFNYRVGPLGFVNFASLAGGEGLDGNLGLRDQIAALTWVRDNIAAFGGDPDCVTVFGQSAGSVSLSLLMISAAARGLFHRAIMGSGGPSLIHSAVMSEHVAALYAEELAIDGDAADRLRAMPVERLLRAQRAVDRRLDGTIAASPWFDGDLLPSSLGEAMTAAQALIPLLAGTARDETRLFEVLPGPRQLPQDRADVARLLYEQAPEQAENILAAYPDTKAGARALATDATFAMNTRHFAERHATTQPVWYYRLDAANPVLGALHGIDCTYIWHFTGPLFAALRGGLLIGRRKALATRMQRHIVNFVRDGAPDPAWPPWSEGEDSTRIYDMEDRFVEGLDAVRRRTWAGVDLLSCGTPP